MKYKLFSDYITLQALLKEQGIIATGGAIKAFLANNTVLFNGEDEKRRGKKLRVGDQIQLPEQGVTITLIQPSPAEMEDYLAEEAERKRVAELVKQLNQGQKKAKTAKNPSVKGKKKPVRFPGT
ncbi:S4 domain-containing protein YaaA [Streptococcus cuniculipharyngis]|uniref:S4 domain-containing protein YaaA n=1 Tax=Streptococcus cuniculipharyngis TaxID=1562651 RepID=A0A5C5SD55_9STRE|nr:S4 domain-containing protein YaaA [Streptococcus cuniculipharyngis]TWS97729.1 S4 domain-containing protein YaaA [Streptococcus cuniculipharyngis]